MNIAELEIMLLNVKPKKHPKCLSTYDEWDGAYDCGYNTKLDCDQCKYGLGRKDPEAKCNQLD